MEGRPITNVCIYLCLQDTSCSCDLDLGPMTLIYELDLHIMEMYLPTKKKVSRSRLSELSINNTDR